ncbi:gliding motility-associated C-terminal domain-containing protein [Mucilaginibacter sp. OK098]|uniref:Ig-like domain-containing protein n=1 Tax=Mucilaginibacter sp. OK098 TaxID=1855297 RepID=UPI0011611BE5|nr:gliding motility-associated C-terminal domain-containing protein [Mucilaginibacter sp. OK098]
MIKKSTRYLTLLVLFISLCFCADAGYLKPVKANRSGKKSPIKRPAPGHIIAFKIPQQIGSEVIDETNHSIGIAVHAGTNVTALVPTITLDLPTSTVNPGSGVPNNFTTAQPYIVDGLTFYSVNVLQARTATPICAGTQTTIPGDPPTPAGILGWEVLDAVTNTWSPAPGANTNPDYQTAVLTSNLNAPKLYTFRRSITVGVFVTWDSYTDLTVNPTTPITGNTITAPPTVTFCAGGDPGNIAGNPATGGDGTTYNYQWQISTDGTNYSDITGAISQSYDPPAITATTWYQRVVTSGTCIAKSISIPVKITIQNALANNTITPPSVVIFCASGDPGNIAGDPVTGGDGITYNYQWQISTDGTNYNDITGAIGQSYDPTAITATTWYQRIVTSGACITKSISNPVKITVQNALANNTITPPLISVFCAGGDPGNIAGDPATGGDGITYNYQWQISADDINFSDITGAIGQNYDPPAITATTWYQRIVTSGACITKSISNSVKITVQNALANNTITPPSVVIFCAGGDPGNITGAPATGGDDITYNYQWQISTDGINFSDVTGAIGQNYDPPAITATTWYQRAVTSGACNVRSFSNPVKIIVQPPLANNILTPPTPSAFCGSGIPGAIIGSTPTGGDGLNYTYQWESSTDNTTFSPVALNGSGKDYTPPSLSVTMYYHRIVVKSGTCSIPLISTSVKIKITPPLTVNTIGSPLTTTFCTSVDPAIIPGGFPSVGDGPNTYIYQWQSSLDGINWTDIPGANSIDYDSPPISVTTSLRRNVTSGACTVPLSSNIVKFTIINSPPNISANPVAPICSGNKATISVASPDPALTYFWYTTPTKDFILFTGPVYITDPLTASQTFYVEASNGTCSSPVLASATVTVNPLPAAPALVTNPVSTCQGATAVLTISNPQPGYTYNWYTTATGGAPASANTTFTTQSINANTTYYAEAVNSSGCVSATRTPVNVSPIPLAQVKLTGTNVCPGEPGTITSDNTDPTIDINWFATPTSTDILYTGNSFITPPVTANTTYYAEVANSCVPAVRASAQVQVIQQLPTPVVSVESAVAPNITFWWVSVTGATGYEVSTDNGQTFTAPSSGSNGTTHTVTGLQIGQSVTIIVRATGGFSCQLSSNSAPVTGTATNPLIDQIFVANAFTPNGDGKNDVVYVHNENIKSLKFYVYDQWGELLYVSQSQQNGWNGTFKGKTEPAGVYVYYLEAIMNDGQQVKKKGTITLLR